VPADKKPMAGYGSFAETIDALETALAKGPYIVRRAVHRGRPLCRRADRLGHDVRHDREAPGFEAYVGVSNARPAAVRAARSTMR
jgi:hypothetical protein